MKFDRIILSSDHNPKFIEFWPLVAKGWRTFFGDVDIWLALVAKEGQFDLNELRKHGNVKRYDPVPDIPTANQAKVARYHLASSWGDETWGDNSVVMTNDLDLLPLQRDYIDQFVRAQGQLFTLGAELYTGPEAGKFTAGYLTAESSVWRKLFDPFHDGWVSFVRSFVGMKMLDHKEDIARDVFHESPDTFSDESLLRALLTINPVPVVYAPRGYNPYTVRALCRANWRFDPKKLADGTYVEAHLPRPLSENIARIQPLVDYLNHV